MAGGVSAQTFSTRSAARILAVSPDRIRYWVKRQLIRPSGTEGGQYRFAFNDLLVMRLAKDLLPGRRHLETVQRCFERVRNILGPARPVTSIRLANEDGRIVVRERDFAFEAESGQLILDFDSMRALLKLEEGASARRAKTATAETAMETAKAARTASEEALIARNMFAEILASGTRNADVHLKISAILERDGDLPSALKHLLSAATIEPANVEVHSRLGALYRKRGDLQSSLKSFIRALEFDSDSLDAHQNLAELYENMGRKREALRHLSAVNRLTRDS
jgi:tetratricopeptide (TPR) repeat protein